MLATIHRSEWLNDNRDMSTFCQKTVELPRDGLLEFLQEQVGGYIDIYHHQGRDWVINDEGLLLKLPGNLFAIEHGLNICGTIVEIHGRLP